MNRTEIEWVKNPDGSQGYTWNPITGCLNGCPYCYARRLANGRLKKRYLANKNLALDYLAIKKAFDRGPEPFQDPFYPRFWPERLQDLITHPKNRKGIFVCDMGELFGDWIPKEWQDDIFSVIRAHPQHRFYLLTNQPQNLAKFSPFPDNCWVGVTATNFDTMDNAILYLEDVKAKIKFLSIEPFLDEIPIPLSGFGVDWIIIGAQTKPTVYPKIEGVQEILVAAHNTDIPVFIKNNLQPLLAKEWPSWKLRQELPSQPKEICPDVKEKDGLGRLKR